MVVGLGNPGGEYEDTRHNAGFKVIDSLAEALRIELRREKFGGRFGSGGYAGEKLILLKPWRFMNASGQVVATAVGFYKLSLCNLLVISDDMSLEPGRIRIRAQGSAGGHNGLADIMEKLGTNEFGRLRIGIGSRGEGAAVEYVLDRPTELQKPVLNEAIERARDAVLFWIKYGIDKAMSEFNRSDE